LLIYKFSPPLEMINLHRGTCGTYKVDSLPSNWFFWYIGAKNQTSYHLFKRSKILTTWINSLLLSGKGFWILTWPQIKIALSFDTGLHLFTIVGHLEPCQVCMRKIVTSLYIAWETSVMQKLYMQKISSNIYHLNRIYFEKHLLQYKSL
jgi:hypothetical protein